MTVICVTIFLSVCAVGTLYSQSNPYVRMNRMWGGVAANGGNAGISYGASNLYLFADYGAFGARFQGGEGYFGAYTLIGTNIWKGTGMPAVFSPLATDQQNGNIVTPLVNYTRYANPNYTVVNAVGATVAQPANNLGTVVVDPSQCIGTSDQSIIVTNGYVTPNIQIQKKVLAWSQQFHDNYAIIDLTITNNSSDTLTGVYIAMSDGEYLPTLADGHIPSPGPVDQFATTRKWFHYYGADQNDTLRVYYCYTSDDPETAGDRIGQPLTQQGGRLLDYNFVFMACLHASKQPYIPTPSYTGVIDPNDEDDMNQPMVTVAANKPTLNLPMVNQTFNPVGTDAATVYNFISGTMLTSEDMTGTNIRPGHHRKNIDELGEVAPGGENGMSPFSNSFEVMHMSFGPYTFGPGQQIRIVKATGIAGISREKAVEVGREWLSDSRYGTNTLDDPEPGSLTGSFPATFVFPANATTTDIKKDKWVSTGIDSVMLTVSRAKYNFLTGYNAPSTPPPPSFVNVAGSSEGVLLRWSDAAAEALPNFSGYRIMKKVGPTDSTYYREIYRSDATDKDTVHRYVDRNVRVGANHYYYIQSMADISPTDPNAHPSERGRTMYSGRVYFYNVTEVKPNAPLGFYDQLDKIAVVPNPFNWNDPNLRGYGYSNPSNLQITFYELPQIITIRIYTESGDLVKTIYHNRPAGSDVWNMTNEAGQTVASGVYVVLFTTPDGGIVYRKLVIAR
jgi:hypothetical protein